MAGAGNNPVVVEIGTDAIKIIQFRKRRGRPRPQMSKIVRIADLKRPLAEEIPPIFKSLGISTKRVVTYLPRKLVTMRFLELPSVDPQEVADMMELQGIKQTPYSREEVALAHTVVGSRQEGVSDIVLAFCQRKFVDERVDLLERCGFKVDRIGVSTEGIAGWYFADQADRGPAPSKDLIALIDQDLNFSDVVFCQNGKFIYSKSILTGGQQTAMEMKTASYKAVLYPEQGVERFCDEVMKAIEFTMEETRLPLPKKAVLIADLTQSDTLRKALEAKLQIPVEFINPVTGLNLPKNAAVTKGGGSITPLLGFGQKKGAFLFDLIPDDVKLSFALEKRNRQMMMTAGLSLALLAVIGFLIAGSFYKKREYLEGLEKEISKTQEYAAGIEKKLALTRLMERVKNPETSFLSYLKKVVEVLGPGVYFSSINFSGGKEVVLKGYAGQMSEVFDFAKALEELKIFKGVKSERVSKKKEGDQVLAEFEIDCLL